MSIKINDKRRIPAALKAIEKAMPLKDLLDFHSPKFLSRLNPEFEGSSLLV